MKDYVEPTIGGDKQHYEVLAGIETEFELDDGAIIQPRIYLIERGDPRPAIYFCYRKRQRGQRPGGYGMFLTDEMIENLGAETRPDREKNKQKVKEALEELIKRLFP